LRVNSKDFFEISGAARKFYGLDNKKRSSLEVK
jgi:hypothetical protein